MLSLYSSGRFVKVFVDARGAVSLRSHGSLVPALVLRSGRRFESSQVRYLERELSTLVFNLSQSFVNALVLRDRRRSDP